MTKITLDNIASGHNSTTVINNDFAEVAQHLNDKVLYRDNPTGTANSMSNTLDMDSNAILNLPAPSSDSEPARWVDVKDGVTTLNALAIPALVGNAGKPLTTDGISLTFDSVDAAHSEFTDAGTGAVTRTVESKLQEFISLADYGAVGDNATDDTLAIQAALDHAATNGLPVYGQPNKTYVFSTLLIKSGVVGLYSNGSVFKPNGSTNASNLTTEAAVVLQGTLTGGTAVSDCVVSIEMDMQSGDRTAILGDGISNCTFQGCKIYGFTNDATYNHRGIRLQEGASSNKVIGNTITGYASPTQRGILIDVYASLTGLPSFGGFFTGTLSQATTPATKNIIVGNHLDEGSYGCNLQGCEYTVVSNNVMSNQNHRGMWVGNASWFNVISNNSITDFTSSAVLCGYGCNYNMISNNSCRNEGAVGVSGEACININTGSNHNTITGNYCDAPMNYSVYIATDSSYNLVDGNYSKNAYVAGFAVENDWIDTLPTNNFYGRPNYADPDTADATATSWTFGDLDGTVIQNNVVHSGYTGRSIAAFYVGQIENDFAGATQTALTNTTIRNNRVLSNTNIGYGLYVYEHTPGEQQNLSVVGNLWPTTLTASTSDFAGANTSSLTLDLRDVGLVYAYGNGEQLDALVNGTVFSLTDGDTTPDVSNWRYFGFSNTSATTVTDFDGGSEGQEIVLRGDVNTTIAYGSGLIRPKGLTNVTGMNSNSLISFKLIGTVWFEMWRNF